MFETIILVCTLAVVVPVLLLVIFFYNLNRKAQGKVELTGEEVLVVLVKRIKEWFANRSKIQDQNPQKGKDNVEDAEFREIN